jgi:hypothetical protein
MRLFVHFLVSCDLTRVHCGSAVIKSKNCHRCISPLLFMRLLENYLSRMAGKCCSTLKVTFAFKSVIIQHVQIKVATYFCVITKVAKRWHVYMCSVALYISIYMCVYIYIYIYIYIRQVFIKLWYAYYQWYASHCSVVHGLSKKNQRIKKFFNKCSYVDN